MYCVENCIFVCFANELIQCSLIFVGEGGSDSKIQVVVEKFPNIEEFELTECAR
jgi:hypothetical protein